MKLLEELPEGQRCPLEKGSSRCAVSKQDTRVKFL
jgi:hypothetical protein